MARVKLGKDGRLHLSPGDYGIDQNGVWWIFPPVKGAHAGVIPKHQVIEHKDETITVIPSILLEGVFHGYLERGKWRIS